MNTTATVPPTASSFDLPEDASLPRRIGLALRALRTLRDDPKDIAAGKALNLSLNRGALARLREELARSEDGRRLLAERPPLDGRVLDLAALGRLPEGTLGREFARYFGANGIIPFENPYPVHSDVEYLSRRYRDEHDLVHVLTGYGTDVPGEVELQAFIVGNLGLRTAALIVVFTTLKVLPTLPDITVRDYLRRVAAAYRRGRAARPLLGVRYEHLWDKPVEQVRAMLDIR
ncbi:Coq4 family protein [Nannocystis pusilla]|uniref:Coq4 family protein n=1 Tax=Nannocystis pusilla TaxID=889268 RepID=UPI003DA38A62